MLLCCNPGEVLCQVMDYTHVITVWTGDVNADANYTPIPAGIAFFCETPSILYTVLSNNGNVSGKTNYPLCFGSKIKELKSQRCILLQLISSIDDYAYDLIGNGFFGQNKIPPYLFRYATKENCSFTVRTFAGTRFGSHRSRPDHKAMRRIQHAAAFLAVTNESTTLVYYNQSCAKTPTIGAISAQESNYNAAMPLTTSSDVITEPLTPTDSKNPILTSPLTISNISLASIGNNTGCIANQPYPLSTTLEAYDDFGPRNHHIPASSNMKMDLMNAGFPACGENNKFCLTNSHNPRTFIAGNCIPYAYSTGSSGRSFSCAVKPNDSTTENPSFLSFPASLTNLNNIVPSRNPENLIHNLESNSPSVDGVQFDISRMSLADEMVSMASKSVSGETKIN
uniref:Uncharacterized protein n=1 Tax=Setaria digitata TaxID=48799 RepID=A0A915Q5N1_9BILA